MVVLREGGDGVEVNLDALFHEGGVRRGLRGTEKGGTSREARTRYEACFPSIGSARDCSRTSGALERVCVEGLLARFFESGRAFVAKTPTDRFAFKDGELNVLKR